MLLTSRSSGEVVKQPCPTNQRKASLFSHSWAGTRTPRDYKEDCACASDFPVYAEDLDTAILWTSVTIGSVTWRGGGGKKFEFRPRTQGKSRETELRFAENCRAQLVMSTMPIFQRQPALTCYGCRRICWALSRQKCLQIRRTRGFPALANVE